MRRVTRRFRAFGDFLYALPCRPTNRPPDPGTTYVRCSHTLTGSPGEGRRRGLRSSAVGRQTGDRGRGPPVSVPPESVPTDRLPRIVELMREHGGAHAAALPEGLHQGVGQEPLPAGVVAAAVVDGADDPVPPGAQRGNEGLAVLDRSGPVVQPEGEVDDGRGCPVLAAGRQVALARRPVPAVGQRARRGRLDEGPAEAFGPGESGVQRRRSAEPLAA